MKTNMKQTIIAFIMFMILFLSYKAVDSQTLTIKSLVTLNDKSSYTPIQVIIIDMDTVNVMKNDTLNIKKEFTHVLKDNKRYLLVYTVKGFQRKSIIIETNHTDDHKYLYTFIVNLHDSIPTSDTKYAGSIFWDNKQDKFNYYLTSYIEH